MKIGFDQLGVSAPLLIRRAVNGYIAIIQPVLVAAVLGMPEDMISKDAKLILMMLVSGSGTVIKWFEYILGTDPSTIQEVKEGDPK